MLPPEPHTPPSVNTVKNTYRDSSYFHARVVSQGIIKTIINTSIIQNKFPAS